MAANEVESLASRIAEAARRYKATKVILLADNGKLTVTNGRGNPIGCGVLSISSDALCVEIAKELFEGCGLSAVAKQVVAAPPALVARRLNKILRNRLK